MIQFGANFSTLGIPETGLSPTITIRDISDRSVVVDAAVMTEIGGGAYKYDFVNDVSKEYSASIDGGSDSLDSRYFSAWSERVKSEAEIVLIKAQTDKITFSDNNIQARVADKGVLNNPPSEDIDAYKADVSAIPTNPLLTNDTRLNNLDAPISSRSNHADPTSNIKGADNRDLTQVFNNERGTDGAYTGTPPTVEEIKTGLEADGTKLTGIKNQTDKMNFTGQDIKATLDGEEVTTDVASREASKADLFNIAIDIKRLLGLNQENYRLFNPIYDPDGNLLSVTTKIYSTAADCNNDTNAIAEYTMEATYSNKQLDTYKVVKI